MNECLCKKSEYYETMNQVCRCSSEEINTMVNEELDKVMNPNLSEEQRNKAKSRSMYLVKVLSRRQ